MLRCTTTGLPQHAACCCLCPSSCAHYQSPISSCNCPVLSVSEAGGRCTAVGVWQSCRYGASCACAHVCLCVYVCVCACVRMCVCACPHAHAHCPVPPCLHSRAGGRRGGQCGGPLLLVGQRRKRRCSLTGRSRKEVSGSEGEGSAPWDGRLFDKWLRKGRQWVKGRH